MNALSEDDERDRLWDHEITGPVVATTPSTHRDKCREACALSKSIHQLVTPTTPDPLVAAPTIYNWRSDNATDVDAETGTCECISALHSVRLSFGSFAGFVR